MTKTILVYTGNSSRSQMAKGFSNYYRNQIWSFTSAGSNPIGLNKNKIHTMDKIGIDVRHQNYKSLKLFDLSDFNSVITLCGDAKNHCPAIPKGAIISTGTCPIQLRAQEIIKSFKIVRNKVECHIKTLLSHELSLETSTTNP